MNAIQSKIIFQLNIYGFTIMEENNALRQVDVFYFPVRQSRNKLRC